MAAKPIRKVATGTLAGALATAIVAAVDYVGAGLPDTLAAAMSFAAMTLVSYLTPSAPGEARPIPGPAPAPPLHEG